MHNNIKVSYSLFTIEADGTESLVERATPSQPFQFITGIGVALDAFEARVRDLATQAEFSFTLPPEEAYGTYDEQHVVNLDRDMFCIDGKFDAKNIFPGNVIPLMNEDGNYFQGTILEVGAERVRVDLNHPLAGKTLKFTGFVVENRPATDEELQGALNMLSGEGCGCGCGCGDDHEHCHHEHGHEHGHGHCHHHGHDHGDGCCCKDK